MSTERKFDVAIIGGGASGLAAAIELRMNSPEIDVLVIEKMPEPGRKLRATGSGRCNITNENAGGYERIMHFFSLIGLVTRRYNNGLVYPYSESAADVVTLLTDRANYLGCEIACSEEVVSIKNNESADNRFEIESVKKTASGDKRITTQADYVILASGGKAGPSYGTTGDGYSLAKSLGHSVVTPVPALTGIECAEWDGSEEPDAHSLAGTRTAGVVSLFKKGTPNSDPLFIEEGEIQFTKYGLSGICVFNTTRHMRFDREKGESLSDFSVKINLFPEGNFEEYVFVMHQSAFALRPIKKLLSTLFKAPLAEYVLRRIGDEIAEKPVADLDLEEIKSIGNVVHELEFHPVKLRGWKDAQMTSGGICMDEINKAVFESKLVKGLYITGEVADRDYPCGGFNLSNAWITGLVAADDISKDIAKK